MEALFRCAVAEEIVEGIKGAPLDCRERKDLMAMFVSVKELVGPNSDDESLSEDDSV